MNDRPVLDGARPRAASATLLFVAGLTACVQDAPLPDLGACAEPPEGVYEYGEIGIGSCLAAPTDLALLDGDTVLAVSNANIWGDFTGGSALFLDLSTVDWTAGRNVIAPRTGGDGVASASIDLPSFNGAMAVAEPRDLLMVTNRLSDDSRTRESDDPLWFIDVADPMAPALAEIGPDGAYLDVGWDPTGVTYAPTSDYAWVVNRTSHRVSIVDLAADPVALVPPGGPTRLDAGTYVDTDGSGSRAGFVELTVTDDEQVPGAHTWSLEWGVGSVRMWIPTVDGPYRMTSNGEALWTRAAAPTDLDVTLTEGLVLSVNAPDFHFDADTDGELYARLVFEDQGAIRGAYAADDYEQWTFEADVLLEPSASWDSTIGAPNMFLAGGSWYLYYAGTDGVDGAIGLATSTDGVTFRRADDVPVLSEDGAFIGDPHVIWDAQAWLWRMYYTVDGVSIGQATSEDLTTWTPLADRFAPAGGAMAPAVDYIGGAFHLYYVDGSGLLAEATSLDGETWTERGAPFALEAAAAPATGVAIQVSPEDAFRLEDQGGSVLVATLEPGKSLDSSFGWRARVAVGQVVDPDDVDATSIQLDSVAGDLAFFTVLDDAGVPSIVGGSVVAGDLLPGDVLLEAGAGGAHDADGVYSPVVVELDGGYVMYYAADAGEVTTVGRATSPDGVTWTADSTPVLTAAADWDSVAIEPGSVQVLDDGTLRLWFSGFDGSRYRVGLAESADGVTFTRVAGPTYDWVFDASGPGDWFDTGVRNPWVVRDGDVDRMWFAGYDGDSWQIGYADRTGDDAEFVSATDADGNERPVLASGLGGFGIGGVDRPVVLADADGWELWYTGYDLDTGRVGRAVGSSVDRFHRDMRLPTLADSWSFTWVPERDEDSITLDGVIDGTNVNSYGCSAITEDADRGFLYVGCKLVPYVYVIDIRDDSTDDFDDLNYLDVESAILVESSTNSQSGMRSMVIDRDRGWLWGVADTPEAIYAIDLGNVVDDADAEFTREQVLAMLPLPRKDAGVVTESPVGPADLAMHPDGHHMFVSNFNDNSVSVYDLSIGPIATLVGEVGAIGENPYAIVLSADGTFGAVGNFAGEVTDASTHSTIALFDADPESPTFLQVKTWLVNK
jgi:DNA-binding beta-propeller fold protein YncE/predicted GH43/DUF377 family glycosyl hydrolase